MPDSGSSALDSAFSAIPAGWFTMGTDRGQEDERPPHRVFVDRFELAVFPVTRAAYARFVAATGHEVPKDWSHPLFAQSDLPVVGVSWLDAVEYCAWRSSQEGRPVRLPTEAEWEHAARGRQSALFPWGDRIPDWIPNGGRGPLPAPWPVTLGEPTDFGLFGIATNIHEWCADWHDANYYSRSGEHNPTGPETGVRRASRGGAWRHAYTMCRVTLRSKLAPSFRYNDYGFRVARSLGTGIPLPLPQNAATSSLSSSMSSSMSSPSSRVLTRNWDLDLVNRQVRIERSTVARPRHDGRATASGRFR